MKTPLTLPTRLLVIYFLPFCCLGELAIAPNSLSDALLDVTVHRLKTYGPDHEIARFISMEQAAWARREVFFTLSRSYLDVTNATKVAGALDVFYRLRGYQPLEWIGGPTFEVVNAGFFARLDAVVLGHFSHFKSLHDDDVDKCLSLYLGVTHAAEARPQLKAIAQAAKDNEQALICLAWHRDPADMDFLLPYMLADTPASRSLPYHFRNSYGQAAIPFLRRAVSEAKSPATREQARAELKRLEPMNPGPPSAMVLSRRGTRFSLSPGERAGVRAAQDRSQNQNLSNGSWCPLFRPVRAQDTVANRNPGRCPGLSCSGLLALFALVMLFGEPATGQVSSRDGNPAYNIPEIRFSNVPISPEMKSETAGEMADLTGPDVAGIMLAPLPADYQTTNELNGVRYFPNVRVMTEYHETASLKTRQI